MDDFDVCLECSSVGVGVGVAAGDQETRRPWRRRQKNSEELPIGGGLEDEIAVAKP